MVRSVADHRRIWDDMAPGAAAVCGELNAIIGHYPRSVHFCREHDAQAWLIGTVTDYLLGVSLGDDLASVIKRSSPFMAGWSDADHRPDPEHVALDYACAEHFLAQVRDGILTARQDCAPSKRLVRLLAVLARFDAISRGGAAPGSYSFHSDSAQRSPESVVERILGSALPAGVEAEITSLSGHLTDTLPPYSHATYNPSLWAPEIGIAADCDVLLDSTLFELKCVKRFRTEHVLQLLAYAALAPHTTACSNAAKFGFLNPFYWLRWSVTGEELFRLCRASPDRILDWLREYAST